MERITVSSSKDDSYEVVVGSGFAEGLCDLLEAVLPGMHEFFLITDENVSRLHLTRLVESFEGRARTLKYIVVPAGEESKSLSTYTYVVDELIRLGMKRRSPLLLLGGGVIMDMGGFVGATFMRGVPVINIPTSLVAQVDASIGGKVAVNHPRAKNFLGSFYNPQCAIVDVGFLQTLSDQEIREGLAEVIKTAIINNPPLFDLVEENLERIFARDEEILLPLVHQTIISKIELLRPDPLEYDLARALNLGHTLAHPLETCSHYKQLHHGQAVAIGLCAATRLAVGRGICSANSAKRIIQLIERAGLPSKIPPTLDLACLEAAIHVVRSVRNGVMNYVVPEDIGAVQILKEVAVPDLISCLLDER